MTIIILHGWGSGAKNWARVKEFLEKKGCQVFLPDLPGFGETPPPPKAWSLDDYVEWVRDFSEKNNLSEFFLLGHSFGGGIAIKFALKYPEKIKKLFLVSSAAIRKKTIKKEILKKIASFFKRFSFLPGYNYLRKVLYKIFFRKSDYLLTEGVMKETYLKVISEDLSDILSNISVPTVIIWGKKDDIFPVKDAYFINQKIKNSVLEILPNIKHNPQTEAPEILAEKII